MENGVVRDPRSTYSGYMVCQGQLKPTFLAASGIESRHRRYEREAQGRPGPSYLRLLIFQHTAAVAWCPIAVGYIAKRWRIRNLVFPEV